jgi:hypothetical protein
MSSPTLCEPRCDADAVVINGGGIRGGKVYPPGTAITRRDILAELPFGNRVILVEIRGQDIWRAIENGLSQLPDPAGRFPQVSGLTIEAIARGPPASASSRSGSEMPPSTMPRFIASQHWIFWAAVAMAMSPFATPSISRPTTMPHSWPTR